MTSLVVISYYDQRPLGALRRLLSSMARFSAGAAHDVTVVVNSDSGVRPPLPESVSVHVRENSGMNIGAWEHGWRSRPGYSDYLFLQDDCRVVRAGWLKAFLSRAETNPTIGLIGESLNPAWDKSWDELARVRAGEIMPQHQIDGRPAQRVDVYLSCMRRWGVDPGASGRHLRSLVWFASRGTLERIGGFPLGADYGECIAAEIAVSRKVEAAGLAIAQLGPAPFEAIAHADWARLHAGGPYVHEKSLPPLRRLLHRLSR